MKCICLYHASLASLTSPLAGSIPSKTSLTHFAELAILIYALYKARNYIFPRLSLVWKNIMAGDKLAYCTFETYDNVPYMCYFDKDKCTWILKYNRGIKTLAPQDDIFVKQEEADRFFKSKFFKRFSRQCQKYIEPYLDKKANESRLTAPDITSDQKQCLEYLISNSNKIRKTMFANKYSML